MLVSKAKEIVGGKNTEELKIDLLNSAEKSKVFTERLKVLLILWFIIFPLLFILSFLTFSYSRKLIWGTKKYWRWNLLILFLSVILFFYLIIYYVLKLLLNYLITRYTEKTILIISSTFNGIFLIIFLIMTFILFKSFSETYKITDAVNKFFIIIKSRRKEFMKYFGIILVVSFIASLLLTYLNKKYYWNLVAWPQWLIATTEILVLLIFAAWLRYYITKKMF